MPQSSRLNFEKVEFSKSAREDDFFADNQIHIYGRYNKRS